MLIGSAGGEKDIAHRSFSCMFYQPVEQAPSRGAQLLAYGYGTLDGTRRRGCPLPLACRRLRFRPNWGNGELNRSRGSGSTPTAWRLVSAQRADIDRYQYTPIFACGGCRRR